MRYLLGLLFKGFFVVALCVASVSMLQALLIAIYASLATVRSMGSVSGVTFLVFS
jgi:hypothetical protein